MDIVEHDFPSFRGSLVKAFQSECQRFDTRLREEIQNLRQQADRVEELERENRRLRGSLERAAQRESEKSLQATTPTPATPPPQGSSNNDTEAGTIPRNVSSGSRSQSIDHALDFQEALAEKDAEIARYKNALDQMTAKARDFRSALIAEREKRVISRSALKAKSRSPAGSPTLQPPNPPGPVHVSSSEHQKPPTQPPDISTVPSSDTTESDRSNAAEAGEPSADQLSSDTPEVIYERSLKRKRAVDTGNEEPRNRVKLERGMRSHDGPTKIKEEYASLPQLHNDFIATQVLGDSMDLDDVSLPLLDTPRRMRRMMDALQTQPYNFHVPVNDPNIAENEPHVVHGQNRTATPRNDQSGGTRQNPFTVPKDSTIVGISTMADKTGQEAPRAGVWSKVQGDRSRGPDVLKPKNPNPRVFPIGTSVDASGKRTRNEDAAVKIALVTEDGDIYTTPAQSWKGGNDMERLLDGPGNITKHSEQHVPQPRSRQEQASAPASAQKAFRPLHDDNEDTQRSSRSPAMRQNAHTEPAHASTRLRDSAKAELQPTDFVLNPARNEGLDYAYADVVRKRDQRKCLPNCTKPECCGNKFDKVIRLGGFAIPQRPSLANELRGIQFSENDRLIFEFSGCEPEQLLTMPEVEKDDLLRRARVWKLGQAHGRHRAAHERRPSPPGFWRTDMPSTQEEQEDRARAEAQERRQVEERYKEAMRPGGRWKFRDEMRRV
jgi:hypothetical protein